MEYKTRVNAENGKQDLLITREFELPVELLFKAYTEAELLEQWMGTKVIQLDCRKHGSWEIETSDPKGNLAFRAHGVFHDVEENRKIVRSFEMLNTPFPVQFEFLEFESLGDDRSKLSMQVIYKSVEAREQLLKLPFAAGLNMAHQRLEDIMKQQKL